MIRLIILYAMIVSQTAFADCDFSKDVQNQDESYIYSKECHIQVGKLVQNEEKRKKQVEELEKVVEIKDLVIIKSHERAEMWRATTFKLEDRVNTIDRMKDTNKWLYFGLGVVTTGFAIYLGSQMVKVK